MNEDMRIQFDKMDGIKIGAASQFFTDTAVALITSMGAYRDEIEREADADSAERMKAIKAALHASWAGTYQAMSEIAFVFRFEPEEVIEQFYKDLEAATPSNDNEIGAVE